MLAQRLVTPRHSRATADERRYLTAKIKQEVTEVTRIEYHLSSLRYLLFTSMLAGCNIAS